MLLVYRCRVDAATLIASFLGRAAGHPWTCLLHLASCFLPALTYKKPLEGLFLGMLHFDERRTTHKIPAMFGHKIPALVFIQSGPISFPTQQTPRPTSQTAPVRQMTHDTRP